ncbi:class I SAM-dependent methyltransferase [Brevibacillus daliensis]|uniref:class I SAM-dependent methyltransferase n=1 Tax=Brevibacillus daliensis TaxID=2892995 RepID=UPI001E5C12A5|nr:methyltransferase [Brevibacillus daliensis]
MGLSNKKDGLSNPNTFKGAAIHDKITFLRTFMKSPKEVGSIIPSSRHLAKRMFKRIDWNNVSSVVELGAGTGVFTKYLNQLIKEDAEVFIYEQDAELAELLKRNYPNYYHRKQAERLFQDLHDAQIGQVDVIISGLPFKNFSQELRDRIVNEIERSLKPGGSFIAFQYSLQMKSQFEEVFDEVSISFEPLNVPPAFIYRIKKKKQ